MDDPASRRVSVPCGTQAHCYRQLAHDYGALTRSGRPSQTVRLPPPACVCKAYNPGGRVHRFGLLRFRSPLLAESFPFLGVLRCFSSPGSLPLPGDGAYPPPGFPIRTSPALAPAHGLPELFAVYHVLRRHLTPRHPPYALLCVNAVIRRPRASCCNLRASGVLLRHLRVCSQCVVYVVVKLHPTVAGVVFSREGSPSTTTVNPR